MPLIRSWVRPANDPEGSFPLNNLPCGVFSTPGTAPRCGVAIGDSILDVAAMEAAGLLPLAERPVLGEGAWNPFMALGPAAWERLRVLLYGHLAEGAVTAGVVAPFLCGMAAARLHLPFRVAGYTDFYAGRHHAMNVGTMLRGPENALPPNWDHMPIGYNGRASSVVVSGTPVRRPWGQIRPEGAATPLFAPSRRFDLELELGAVVGVPSSGPVSVARAEAMIFGYVLLNDWSARDIQAWEYQPLGPFNAKATATTISPWIVPAAALAPFRVPGPERAVPLLPYLAEPHPMTLDIALEVALAPAGQDETVIARTSARNLWYSFPQQLCHHSTAGAPMQTGDLLGSGTISGPGRGERGSLLELAWGGREPLDLPGGQRRSFLEDGDTVSLRGHARAGGVRIGLGACTGTILPAAEEPFGGGQ
ncbi:MAG: fumarylacetoacetase [Rhodobacteraceae bacterium]|jgi:fumarylacetoacetase|nr:fumarylacetoacetase [Paracoccaceae bacterium]